MEFRHTLPAADVIFGNGRRKLVGDEAAKLGKNALLVTGKGSMRRLGFLDEVLSSLENAGVTTVHYGGVEPNPTTVTVDEGAKLAKREKCGVVIALGGGSAIDTAKGIAVVVGHGSDGVWSHVPKERGGGGLPITNRTLPIVTIPSTSGSGSHVTPFAVVTNPKTKGKPGFGAPATFPKVSIVDPEILREMSSGVTATAGFDVCSHLSEDHVSRGALPTSDPYTVQGLKYVAEFLPRAYRNGRDMEAREMMAVADTYAGLCNTMAGTVLTHAVGHSVSGCYPEVAHGQALATLAVPVMEYNIDRGDKGLWRRYSEIAVALGRSKSPGDSKEDALEAVKAISGLIEVLGLDKTLSELGVEEECLGQMTEDTFTYMMKGVRLNPVEVTKEGVAGIFRKAF